MSRTFSSKTQMRIIKSGKVFFRQKLVCHEFIWHSETFLTGMKMCKVKFFVVARLIQDWPIYRYLKYVCLWLILSVKLIFYFYLPILASGKIMKFKVKTIQLAHTSPCVLPSLSSSLLHLSKWKLIRLQDFEYDCILAVLCFSSRLWLRSIDNVYFCLHIFSSILVNTVFLNHGKYIFFKLFCCDNIYPR